VSFVSLSSDIYSKNFLKASTVLILLESRGAHRIQRGRLKFEKMTRAHGFESDVEMKSFE
jgi:hypothetical protein